MNKTQTMRKIKAETLSFFLVGAIVLSGCGGSPSGGSGPDFLSSNNRCPRSGFINLDASCCDGGGTQVRFDGVCSPATATTPAVAGALTGAATAGQVASNANTAARNMESGQGAASTGGLQGAATAVNGLSTTINRDDRGAAAKSALAISKDKKSKTLGAAGSGAAASGGGSGLPGNYGGSTLPNVAAAQADALSKVNFDSGGGAGSGASGTSGGFRMPGSASRGSEDSGISAGAPSGDSDFGGASGISPIGSLDPEDYFTRLETSDSLFKIVERRYKKTTMSWALLGINKTPRGEIPKLEIEGLK